MAIGGTGNLTVNGPTTWSNGGFEATNTSVMTTFNGALTLNGRDHQIADPPLGAERRHDLDRARILIGFGASMSTTPVACSRPRRPGLPVHGRERGGFDNLGTLNKEIAGTTTTIPSGFVFNNLSTAASLRGIRARGGGNSTGSFRCPRSTSPLRRRTSNLNAGSTLSGAGSLTVFIGTTT